MANPGTEVNFISVESSAISSLSIPTLVPISSLTRSTSRGTGFAATFDAPGLAWVDRRLTNTFSPALLVNLPEFNVSSRP